ncbi:MAG: hypothetical protein NC347_00190 [Clostridium sp.]|nr:hypothetical protein [Clostridium sp.]
MLLIYNIEWKTDSDDKKMPLLPQKVIYPGELKDIGKISDWLKNLYGCDHYGFKVKETSELQKNEWAMLEMLKITIVRMRDAGWRTDDMIACIYDLYQDYRINEDMEIELYDLADPQGKYNACSIYWNDMDYDNPLSQAMDGKPLSLNTELIYKRKEDKCLNNMVTTAVVQGIVTNQQMSYMIQSLEDGKYFQPRAMQLPADSSGVYELLCLRRTDAWTNVKIVSNFSGIEQLDAKTLFLNFMNQSH